jgi:hypothetical protein
MCRPLQLAFHETIDSSEFIESKVSENKVDNFMFHLVPTVFSDSQPHRHLSNIDCLTVCRACLACFISSVNGRSKRKKSQKRSDLYEN